MVKWLSNIEGKKNRSLVPSTIITLFIVGMLILSGPAQAVAVSILNGQDSYTKGSDIDFQIKLDINDPDQYVSITNISLDLNGPVNQTIFFTLDGKRISPGGCNIEITPVSIPKDDFGYGDGYGYDSGYGYNLGKGYGYGYGYGGGGGGISYIYNVTIHTAVNCMPAGTYEVVASLNSGNNVAFKSAPFKFTLNQATILNASVEIKPETLNLESKGIFTAFITSNEFDIEKINGSTVRIITCYDSASAVKWNTADKKFIAQFRTQDLHKVQTGEVEFTVTGELLNGTKFVGSDTVKVIDNAKDQKDVKECECDKPVKDDDHEDECDDQVKEHENEDNKVKDHSPEKNKEDNKKSNNGEKNKQDDKKNINNGGQGKTVVINNIYINDNSGTVNVNINNQGSSTVVNQGSNSQKENNGNSKNQGNNGGNKDQSNNRGKK